jgi:hypothetical protein
VTTGGRAGSHEGVTTLFEVRLPAAAATAASSSAAAAATGITTSSSVSLPANARGCVIAKALLSYQRARSDSNAPVPGCEKRRLQQTAQPIPRLSPCLEWVEVLGQWRGRGVGRRLMQVRVGRVTWACCGMR